MAQWVAQDRAAKILIEAIIETRHLEETETTTEGTAGGNRKDLEGMSM
jgi:hypothetical protein